MLAGHEESSGDLIEKKGEEFKVFDGMRCERVMNKHVGGVANYKVSEEKAVEVTFRGNLDDTVIDILGGLRSTGTWVRASKLKELIKRTTYIRVQEQENQIYN